MTDDMLPWIEDTYGVGFVYNDPMIIISSSDETKEEINSRFRDVADDLSNIPDDFDSIDVKGGDHQFER